MELLTGVLIGGQFIFTLVATVYFFTNIKSQDKQNSKKKNFKKEMDDLNRLRNISLTKPLSEKTRPETFSEIIGQEKGIRALRAALCGTNPQHVIIYGSPGIGKTCVARLILKEAIQNKESPFTASSPFIEIDATTLQFDERSIADPLLGSVHDPIYQGSGTYGQAGIPQPKMGAVTKAHGGILFIDEIGELNPIQMNRLLKVLEDRKVFLTSSYYSKGMYNMPKFIEDIFENGLPADFRLIGATTKSPEDLPPALRSRCSEIYFSPLKSKDIELIAKNAISKYKIDYEYDVLKLLKQYAVNGRDSVNIISNAISFAVMDNRKILKTQDIEEILEIGKFNPRNFKEASKKERVGVINGLAISGVSEGLVIEIEAISNKLSASSKGVLNITGIIEEEQIKSKSGYLKRKSSCKSSVENIITALEKFYFKDITNYNIHVNFLSNIVIDGPSAGLAILCAIYSAITQKPICGDVAMTGEISIKGDVLAVGGVSDKIEAAVLAGITKVYIPASNYQSLYDKYEIQVIPINNIFELIPELFDFTINQNIENIKNKETIIFNLLNEEQKYLNI